MGDNISELSMGQQLNRMAGVVDKSETFGAKPKTEMDKEAFMRMLFEQMKNQDPFNPVKNEQFAQQLTLMSQLEQQVSMNKNMEKMIANQNNSHLAALQVVGKDVIAEKASVFHQKDEVTSLKFNLDQELRDVKVTILDGNGNPVKEIPMGHVNKGDVETRWDGYADSGFPADTGRYTYKIKGATPAGAEVSVPTRVEGRVTGVTSGLGKVFLMVGEQRVSLDDVQSIKESKTEDKKDTKVAQAETRPATQVPVSTSEDANTSSGTENEVPSVGSSLDDRKLNDLLPLLYR
ncbi:MAG: flagellar hook assembly protein FlgD [Proteobacteria bacterium]|nr:flagellar hook assembly protein FlgD [Pseudomonadota bacterium]